MLPAYHSREVEVIVAPLKNMSGFTYIKIEKFESSCIPPLFSCSGLHCLSRPRLVLVQLGSDDYDLFLCDVYKLVHRILKKMLKE